MVDQQDCRVVGRDAFRGAILVSVAMLVSRSSLSWSADFAAKGFRPSPVPSPVRSRNRAQDSRLGSFGKEAPGGYAGHFPVRSSSSRFFRS